MAQLRPMRTYFFDTSAIVKLLLDEPGSKEVRAIRTDRQVFTSWVLLAEALGVLKGKWRKKLISEDQYTKAVHLLFCHICGKDLKPVDLEVTSGSARLTTYERDLLHARTSHPTLDAADALQLVAIRKSILGNLRDESEPQLVTADRGLSEAAEKEGIRVRFLQGPDSDRPAG